MHIDVIGGVSKIVMFLQEREYVKAHDQYMLMAIGNAPWPIGVTAVGIHDRTGRERIGSNKIAHIMDDEGTRKYLNAVKRLLTYVQKSFPTDQQDGIDIAEDLQNIKKMDKKNKICLTFLNL